MKEQAERLAAARTKFQELFTQHSQSWVKWEKENAALIESVGYAKEEMQAAESALRDAGLAHYEAHPESKKLPHGLGVRVNQSIVYDADVAFVWAQEHKMALVLDKKAFEKIAKVSPPEFVTISEVPTITIPTDTNKLLEE